MHHFRYSGQNLFCEGVAVESLARRYGTPLYLYSERTLREHYQRLRSAMSGLDHRICYAVKANGNLAILRVLRDLGSGYDIVSGGELQRVIAAGGDPGTCVFAGVGKSEEEIRFALRRRIYSFNVESVPELERISRVARRIRRIAPISVRVNPDVDANAHAKITTGTHKNKFGIAFGEVDRVYEYARKLPNVWIRGVQMHIGSQLTSVKPFEQAVRKVAPLVTRLRDRYQIEFFSIGGGIGIVSEPALASGQAAWWKSGPGARLLTPERYAARLVPLLQGLGLTILTEPGRFIAGNAGILVTRIEYIKETRQRNFAVVDAAMNDLIRPSMYDAYHEIVPTRKHRRSRRKYDLVGPVCESGDCFAHDRNLVALREGESLAILSAGAYGLVMASNYNARPFPAEVLVNGRKARVVRKRQRVAELWQGERVAP